MQIIHVHPESCVQLEAIPTAGKGEGFLWIDVLHAEVHADPEGFRARVEQAAGARIFDLHLQDAVNLQHPWQEALEARDEALEAGRKLAATVCP